MPLGRGTIVPVRPFLTDIFVPVRLRIDGLCALVQQRRDAINDRVHVSRLNTIDVGPLSVGAALREPPLLDQAIDTGTHPSCFCPHLEGDAVLRRIHGAVA